jgi:glycosyltransferase involved in cell wall biosynthesis
MAVKVIHVVLNLNPYNNRTRIHRMANSLARSGHYTVKIICLQDRKRTLAGSADMDGFLINRIGLCSKNLPKIMSFIKYAEFLLKARSKIRSFKPEIIHCHDLNTLAAGVISAQGAKIIYDSHELEPNRSGIRRWQSYLVGLIERFLIKFVSGCITVNDEIADILNRKYGIKVHAIYNAYSPAEIQSDGRVSIRKVINAHQDAFVAIYPGVLSFNRGLLRLIESVPYLNQNVVIVMIGYGPHKAELQQAVSDRKLEERVHILDAVPYQTVIQYIATSDLGLMPTLNASKSLSLGLGNKFFQYVAAGIPVAVSDQPVKTRMVRKYRLGVLFNPDKPDDIAKKINSVVNDKEKLSVLKKNCLNAQQYLCWEREEHKLKTLYHTLLYSELHKNVPYSPSA